MTGKFVQVYTANGHLDAEMIRLFLESNGIVAEAQGESVGAVYGLTVGPLGEVKILVPEEQADEARRILVDMEAGKYEVIPLPDSEENNPQQIAPDELNSDQD